MYVRTLVIVEQQLGASHHNTASSLNNLAMLYQNQGKYVEAELLVERALAIYERELGPNHPNTQIVRANSTTLRATMQLDE